MAVFRVEKTKDFTIMCNHHLRNTELSLKAKGLLSLMLSLPEDWDYTTKGLAHICKDGVDSITTALKELERHGYLTRQRLRYGNGQLGDIEYTIHEKPVNAEKQEYSPKRENPRQVNPGQAKPEQAEPGQENPAQLNTNPLRTKKSKTDISRTHQSIYEHGELDQYHASHKANIACREAIEQAIADNYRDNRLGMACVRQVLQQFDPDRIFYVLANTVRQKDYDGRISRDNKAWAQTVPVCENKDGFGYDRNVCFAVDRCNPGLTDLFLSQARRECAPAQEQKPSVRDSLNKNAGQQTAHSNKTKVNKEQAR